MLYLGCDQTRGEGKGAKQVSFNPADLLLTNNGLVQAISYLHLLQCKIKRLVNYTPSNTSNYFG